MTVTSSSELTQPPPPQPVPVCGILNKHSPYIGYFYYANISKNIASFFANDVTTMDEVELRRRVRFHPYTGCFHFAPGQYSDLHGLEPYRQGAADAHKMDLSPEAQMLYEAGPSSGGSDTGPPSPTPSSKARPRTPLSASHSNSREGFSISRSNSRDSSFRGFSRSNSNSKEQQPVSLLNPGSQKSSPAHDRDRDRDRFLQPRGTSSSSYDSSDGELRSFSPGLDSPSDEVLHESRAMTLLEFKKRMVVERKGKHNKKFLTRRESESIPQSPQKSDTVTRRKKKNRHTVITRFPETGANNSFSKHTPPSSGRLPSSSSSSCLSSSPPPPSQRKAAPTSRPVYSYGTHEHDINTSSDLTAGESPRPRSISRDMSPPSDFLSGTPVAGAGNTVPPSPQGQGPGLRSPRPGERERRASKEAAINLSCSMGSWQVHNQLGTNGFINNNIKSKVYDHSVKTYEHVTQSHSGFRHKDSAMDRLRELTLSGEDVHVSTSDSPAKLLSQSCQPRLVDDYRLHLDSMLGEGAYARVFLATCLKTRRPVAVKVVHKYALNATQEACVRRELSNQARLWHPNVVPLQAIYESKKHIYIVLEYCAAGTLEDMLSLRRKLTEEESRYVAFQLITALHYVHSSNILHGDITPANVIFQPASLLSSSSGVEGRGGGGLDIPRVDLLYEKKRREGNITITLLQAPVVNYQRRSRDGQSEKSGGSYADRAASASTAMPDSGTDQDGKPVAGRDLLEDLDQAEMREYLVHTKDIQLINTEVNDSLPSLRRDTSSGMGGDKKASAGKKLGGGSDFTSAAIRNSKLEKKRRSNSITKKEPALSSTPEHDTTAELGKPVRSSSVGSSSSGSSNSSGGSGGVEVSSSSGRADGSAESWWEHQYIRYKCPYGMLLRVGDFGLCQKVPDVRHFQFTGNVNKAPYTPGGTEGYLPPEVIQHLPYGQSADLWAVGTVLFRCISGAHPFVPNESCLTKQLNFKSFAWKKASPACVDFVQSLLQKDEAQRPSARALLAHPWFAEYALISDAMLPE